MRVRSTLFLLAFGCAGCTDMAPGPTVDLRTALAPPPQEAPPPVPPTPPGPTASPGTFRSWVPRKVQPNGDTISGHWMESSTAPPRLEVAEPKEPVPRAPKKIYGPKATEQGQAKPPAQPPQAMPQPVWPSALTDGLAGTHGPQRAAPQSQLPMMQRVDPRLQMMAPLQIEGQ